MRRRDIIVDRCSLRFASPRKPRTIFTLNMQSCELTSYSKKSEVRYHGVGSEDAHTFIPAQRVVFSGSIILSYVLPWNTAAQ